MMDRDVEECKKEIQNFVEMINVNTNKVHNELFQALAKKILFFKYIIESFNNGHYAKFMIYDMLMTVYLIVGHSKREIYNSHRSLIENFMRYCMELDDNDSMGVMNLFRKFNEKYSNSDTKNIIRNIESEYDDCCNYVHSNIKADINLYLYLQDIIKDKGVCDGLDKENMLKRILGFYEYLVRFWCFINPNSINKVFYRKNQTLKYLIGEDNYNIARRAV